MLKCYLGRFSVRRRCVAPHYRLHWATKIRKIREINTFRHYFSPRGPKKCAAATWARGGTRPRCGKDWGGTQPRCGKERQADGWRDGTDIRAGGSGWADGQREVTGRLRAGQVARAGKRGRRSGDGTATGGGTTTGGGATSGRAHEPGRTHEPGGSDTRAGRVGHTSRWVGLGGTRLRSGEEGQEDGLRDGTATGGLRAGQDARAGGHTTEDGDGRRPAEAGGGRRMGEPAARFSARHAVRATHAGRRPANRPPRPGAPHPTAGCAGWSGCRSGRPAPQTRRRCGRGGG